VTIYAYYDKSTDESLSILQNVPIILYINEDPPLPTRVERIAKARNGILAYIREHPTDFFIMMDSNDYSCIGRIRPFILKNAIDQRAYWDALSFDRADGYYDYWALRYDPFTYSFYHFPRWEEVKERLVADFAKVLEEARRRRALIPVLSAFNGFAIYKSEIFLKYSYSDVIPKQIVDVKKMVGRVKQNPLDLVKGDCEHCAFHYMAKGARIRISTEWLFEATDKRFDKRFDNKKIGMQFL
jgi:hypothetical protein